MLTYKNFLRLFLSITIVLILVITFSCNKESSTILGEDTLKIDASLGTGQLIISVKNTVYKDTIPSSCTFSILNKKGDLVYKDINIKLRYQDSNTFTTSPIMFNSGYYLLNSFQVFDFANNVIYQEKQLTSSNEFKIENNKFTSFEPSLLAVSNEKNFFTYVYYFNVIQNKYITTTASVTLSNEGEVFYTGSLSTNVNLILIPAKFNYFIVDVTKPMFKTCHDSILVDDLPLYKRLYPYSIFLIQ